MLLPATIFFEKKAHKSATANQRDHRVVTANRN